VQTIYEYSLGISVRCCNEWNCLNEIHFDSRFAMELNAQQNMNKELTVFQYYIRQNITPNVALFGKKRRIFCEECTEYELAKCITCNARTEVEGINQTLKCQKCLDNELEIEKAEMLASRQQQNRLKRAREQEAYDAAKAARTARAANKKLPDIDPSFIRFKEEIYPQIDLENGSRRNRLMKALRDNGMHIESLPYCLWSERCNLIPNCRRQYCAYWHNHKERELGRIILQITKQRKADRYFMRRKEFHYYQNSDLMDYDFNIAYVQDKMSKKRENNSRKYSIQRKTNKKDKKRAYILRKKDKRGNAKQHKRFKGKHGASFMGAVADYCGVHERSG